MFFAEAMLFLTMKNCAEAEFFFCNFNLVLGYRLQVVPFDNRRTTYFSARSGVNKTVISGFLPGDYKIYIQSQSLRGPGLWSAPPYNISVGKWSLVQ